RTARSVLSYRAAKAAPIEPAWVLRLRKVWNTGEFFPEGRKTQDGRIADRYNLVELTTKSHPAHTGRNVEESDGTMIFSIEQSSAFDALFFSAPSANSREK